MRFDEAVSELCSGCPGALGAAIVDPDGIPVAATPDGGRLEDVGAQFATIIREVQQAERELHHGGLEQLTVYGEGSTLILTLMGGGYFLVLLLGSDGLLGKGRFLSRVTGERLYDEFV